MKIGIEKAAMSPWPVPVEPQLLMASHCFPDVVGSADRMRAWQLLRLVSRTCRVSLACVVDGPVSLAMWRLVRAQVDRLLLAPVEVNRSGFGWLRRTNTMAGRDEIVSDGRVLRSLGSWTDESRFDMALGTHPRLLELLARLGIGHRICDMPTPWIGKERVSASHNRRWLKNRSSGIDRQDFRLTIGCDLVTTCDDPMTDRFEAAGHNAITLPRAIDIDYLAPQWQATGQPDPMRLVFHGDWSHRQTHKSLAWFTRRIWPRTHRVLGGAEFESTRPQGPSSTLDALRNARVVVVPGQDPARARFAVLQALAMGKVVIVSQPVGQALGLRHGQHAYLAQGDNAWATLSVRSLESPHVRFHLSKGGLTFVRQWGPDPQSGRAFLRALREMSPPQPALRQAA